MKGGADKERQRWSNIKRGLERARKAGVVEGELFVTGSVMIIYLAYVFGMNADVACRCVRGFALVQGGL